MNIRVTRKPLPEDRWRIVRDIVTFIVGILGVIYETVIAQVDRPVLLAVFAAMIGLPAFLATEVKPQPDENKEEL